MAKKASSSLYDAARGLGKTAGMLSIAETLIEKGPGAAVEKVVKRTAKREAHKSVQNGMNKLFK